VTGTGNTPGPESVADPHRPILVAVDFSDDSRAALLWASAFAACAGGRLFVLHVVHDPASQPGYYRNGRDRPLQTMEQVAESMLEDLLAKLRIEYPELSALATAETKLVSGLPPGRITEVAEMVHAKLIVIGSRGMTGLPHLMQGSVSERVVELANGPVVVVKAPGERRRKGKAGKKAEKERKKQRGEHSKPEETARELPASAGESKQSPVRGGE